MNRREAWRAILDAGTDVDRMVASAVGDYPDRAPVRPSGSGVAPPQVPSQSPQWQDPGVTQRVVLEPSASSPTDGGAPRAGTITEQERRALDELHRRVKGRIDALAAALAELRGYRDAMNALVIYLDERIMQRLPDYLQSSWPLLHREHTGSITGGEDFYRQMDGLPSSTPSFVFEVYYFCLEHGFVGRYANDMESIERYRHRLRESIDQPKVPTESNDTAEVSTNAVKPVSAWTAYAISLASVVVITATLTILSNF